MQVHKTEEIRVQSAKDDVQGTVSGKTDVADHPFFPQPVERLHGAARFHRRLQAFLIVDAVPAVKIQGIQLQRPQLFVHQAAGFVGGHGSALGHHLEPVAGHVQFSQRHAVQGFAFHVPVRRFDVVDPRLERPAGGLDAGPDRVRGEGVARRIPPVREAHAAQGDHRDRFIGSPKPPVLHAPPFLAEP